MAQIGRRCDDIQLPVYLQAVKCLYRLHNHLQNTDKAEQEKKRTQPLILRFRKEHINKEPGKARLEQADQGKDCGDASKDGHILSGRLYLFQCKIQDTLSLSALDKGFAGAHHQADPGIPPGKFLYRKLIAALCGIIEKGPASAKSVEHNKVVIIPINNAGVLCLLPQGFQLIAVSLRLHPVQSSGFHHIKSVGAVPGNAAFVTDLFQREIAAIMG